LDGCKIVLSGTFPGVTHALIKTKAEGLGATMASAVTDGVTHLVASETDFNKPSPKVSKAQSLGNIHIVGMEWLSLCEQNNAKEPEDDHLLGTPAKDAPSQTDASKTSSSQANGTATAPTTTRTRKRAPPAAADVVSDSEAAPKAKKTRGRKAAAVKTEADEDTEMKDANGVADVETKEEKKEKVRVERAVGEGQVAKDKNMQVPLDEGCPFPTSKVYIDDAGVIYDASLNQTNASNNNNKFYRIQVRYRHQPTSLVPMSDRFVALGGPLWHLQDVDEVGPRWGVRADPGSRDRVVGRGHEAV
jgi:poly [ADP-ribose] polymerase